MIILCLGDSLTAGFPGYSPAIDGISHGYGNEKSQYEYWLEKSCQEYLKEKINSKSIDNIQKSLFINKGIPGELTGALLERIELDLIRIKPKPDYSIIIGGTNDLGWGVSPEKIVVNIKKLHEISRKAGIKSIGSTIPPIRSEKSSLAYNRKKVRLNNLLVDFFVENNIPHIDLYKGMADDHNNLREEYAYIDGLHFSENGYKQMGEIIFKDVFRKILDNVLKKR